MADRKNTEVKNMHSPKEIKNIFCEFCHKQYTPKNESDATVITS